MKSFWWIFVLAILCAVYAKQIDAALRKYVFSSKKGTVVWCVIFVLALSAIGVTRWKSGTPVSQSKASKSEEYTLQYEAERADFAETLNAWGLDMQMTVAELSDIAQNTLNSSYGSIQIESEAFQQLVAEMFRGDAYPLSQMAEDDPEFGALYLYMCIYYDENICEDTGNFTNQAEQPLKSETMEMTLQEVFQKDFDRNFQEDPQGMRPTATVQEEPSDR